MLFLNHYELMKIGRELGYETFDEGLCKGFTAMWAQAICCGDLDNFERRLQLLQQYGDPPEQLSQAITQARQIVAEKGEEVLTEEQKDLLEVPAFFDGIAAYLRPMNYYEMMGNKILLQYQEIEISQYLQSEKLEKVGGLRKAFQTNDQYSRQELSKYLNAISEKLKGETNVAIDFTANSHSVGVRVLGPNQFQLVDTNHLYMRRFVYNSEQLAEKLNEYFFNTSWLDWFREPAPLVMNTSIFTNQNNPINLDSLKAPTSSKITELTPNKSGATLMQWAAATNDVATLERIDFTQINVNQIAAGGHVLASAVLSPCNEEVLSPDNNSAVFLLTNALELNVNPPDIPSLPTVDTPWDSAGLPLCCAIRHKKYDLAQKITEHKTFRPEATEANLNNALHVLAYTHNPTKETLSFAKDFIVKSVELNQGGVINQKNKEGNTPLYQACARSGSTELVKLFLENGAEINELNSQHRSVLHAAVLGGNVELVKLLATKGLNFNLRDKEGFRPLDLACRVGNVNLLCSVLAKTTLTREDIKPNSSLVQLVNHLGPEVQTFFIKKALKSYIAQREKEPEYLNLLNLGIPGKQKIDAAKALLDKVDGLPTNLEDHKEALTDGLLSSIYELYNKPKPQAKNTENQESRAQMSSPSSEDVQEDVKEDELYNKPKPQAENTDNRESYAKMFSPSALGVPSQSSEHVQEDVEEQIISPPLSPITLEKKEEGGEHRTNQYSSSPTPFKTTPF